MNHQTDATWSRVCFPALCSATWICFEPSFVHCMPCSCWLRLNYVTALVLVLQLSIENRPNHTDLQHKQTNKQKQTKTNKQTLTCSSCHSCSWAGKWHTEARLQLDPAPVSPPRFRLGVWTPGVLWLFRLRNTSVCMFKELWKLSEVLLSFWYSIRRPLSIWSKITELLKPGQKFPESCWIFEMRAIQPNIATGKLNGTKIRVKNFGQNSRNCPLFRKIRKMLSLSPLEISEILEI